jgi:hypothetical protein
MAQMIPIEELDYTALNDGARTRLPALTGEWTDYNYHVPGITVLQLFAWLNDTLL